MRRHTSSPTDVTAPLLHDDEAKPKEPPSNRLEPAPPAVCYLVAVAYVYLCDQGVEHCRRLQKTGRTDVGARVEAKERPTPAATMRWAVSALSV